MNLVVVSNRVARGKANEPMTGGLAAALLPVVENSGAIWVGSSGRVRDGAQKEPFAEIEALGSGALAMLDLPAAHYGGYYEGFANSALWPALHSRTDLIRASQDDYRQLSRSQRLHGARAAALPEARHRVLDPGLSFPGAGRGTARSRRHPAARLLPAHALAGARRHRRRAASSRTDRGDAGLRSDRIPDRGRLRQFPRLSPVGSRPRGRRRRRHLALRQDPRRGIPDRHRSGEIRRSRRPRPCRIPTCRGCGAA